MSMNDDLSSPQHTSFHPTIPLISGTVDQGDTIHSHGRNDHFRNPSNLRGPIRG
jgi:hypothetical protein